MMIEFDHSIIWKVCCISAMLIVSIDSTGRLTKKRVLWNGFLECWHWLIAALEEESGTHRKASTRRVAFLVTLFVFLIFITRDSDKINQFTVQAIKEVFFAVCLIYGAPKTLSAAGEAVGKIPTALQAYRDFRDNRPKD